jgi:hypothetical protein
MTSNPDALLPSAKEVMQKIALAEAEEAEKHARMLAEAQAEKKALIDQLSKPFPMKRQSPAESRSSSAR